MMGDFTKEEIDVDMIMGLSPCEEWTRERVESYIGEGKTLLEILDLSIDASDRIWAVTQFLPDKTNQVFAIWCARQCETDVKEVTQYIDVIERYYAGAATNEELSAAWGAAYSAVDLDAIWAVYWAADSAAYSAADWAAYTAADWVADKVEMQKRQIDKLKQMIQEGE